MRRCKPGHPGGAVDTPRGHGLVQHPGQLLAFAASPDSPSAGLHSSLAFLASFNPSNDLNFTLLSPLSRSLLDSVVVAWASM
jgi:hypothetical protein